MKCAGTKKQRINCVEGLQRFGIKDKGNVRCAGQILILQGPGLNKKCQFIKKVKYLIISVDCVPCSVWAKYKALIINAKAFHTVRGVPGVPMERF